MESTSSTADLIQGEEEDEQGEEGGGAQLTDPNEIPPYWTLWSGASYAVVMLLIGLPLWWRTTTVERVPLPYYEMLNLHGQFQDNFIIPLNVVLKGFSLDVKNNIEPGHCRYFPQSLSSDETEVIRTARNVEEIDYKLCKIQHSTMEDPNLHLFVYNIHQSDVYKAQGEQLFLGNCRNIYFVSNSPSLNEAKLNSFLAKLTDFTKTEEDLPLAVNYNILFTLIVPEPEFFDAKWNIEKGVQDYIHPMLRKLTTFSSFVTRAQTLFYHKLNLKPSLVNGVYQIPHEQLPLVINPVESKLTSFVSENPVFNFLIYVSPCDVSPLQILDENGAGLSTNSFYVPQWGGIQIYNSQCNKNQSDGVPVTHEVKMSQVMSVIISQFRDLIGVPNLDESTRILDFKGSALRDWEVHLILRKRLEKLLETSSNTLKSLGTLLGQITNIVVTEEVGKEVELSVISLKLAFEEATAGNITKAQSYAQTAFTASELAFHHPSNLAQLYFPDDQKYAIYIPLYLPVGIPVLLSLRGIVKNCIALWKKRKEKLE